MKPVPASRRSWLKQALLGVSGLALSACDRITQSAGVNATLERAEGWTYRVQRLLLGPTALAREYSEADISRDFRANGTTHPDTDEYHQLAQDNFASWRLQVDGLVNRPLQLSLAELRTLPARTQITLHHCVEGWSAIAKWRGTQLSTLLDMAGLKPTARYLAFYCADTLELTLDGTGSYYETIDLIDARHPQTLLAYEMNDQPLPIAHGAPLRLRVERQLGYKMAKYLMRIEAIDDFSQLGRGKGGYWEDRGYQWYAGI